MKKNNSIKIIIYTSLLLFIILSSVIIVYYIYDKNFTEDDIEDNQTESNISDVIITLTISSAVLIFMFILASVLKVYIGQKKRRVKYSKEQCMKAASNYLNSLNKRDYRVYSLLKHSYNYYGADEEKNPMWAFVFISKQWPNPHNSYIPPHFMVSCLIDASNLEVSNEQIGLTFDELKKELHDQRFGKLGVLNHPGKPDKEPSITDLFSDSKKSINLAVDDDD